MTAHHVARFYLVAMAIGLAPIACRSTTERDRVDFERMRSQQRYAEYSASKVFPDGMSMRTLPAGTISREEHELGETVTTGRSKGAFVTSSPVPVTPSVLEQGAHTYRIYCAVCHGEDGATRTILGANMRPVHPPSLLTSHARAHSPGELFEVITLGSGRMPAYGWSIPPAERWSVIAYLARLQEGSQ